MLRRSLRLILLALFLLLPACGTEDEGDRPPGIPLTPGAGTPIVEGTTAIFEPAEHSPDELGTPQAGDEASVEVEEEPETSGLQGESSSEEIFGVDIPVPEEATLVAVDNEDAERYSKASYEVEGMRSDDVLACYQSALPEAGFTIQERDLQTGEGGETLRFTTGAVDKSGLITIVEARDSVRLTISTGSIDE